jgi:hypothetical protein
MCSEHDRIVSTWFWLIPYSGRSSLTFLRTSTSLPSLLVGYFIRHLHLFRSRYYKPELKYCNVVVVEGGGGGGREDLQLQKKNKWFSEVGGRETNGRAGVPNSPPVSTRYFTFCVPNCLPLILNALYFVIRPYFHVLFPHRAHVPTGSRGDILSPGSGPDTPATNSGLPPLTTPLFICITLFFLRTLLCYPFPTCHH